MAVTERLNKTIAVGRLLQTTSRLDSGGKTSDVRIDVPDQRCRHRASVPGPHTRMTMAVVSAIPGPPTPMSKCKPLTGNSM